MLPLKSEAEDLAIKSLNMENVVEMFSLANIYSAGVLLEATRFFILENKKTLGQQDLSQVPQAGLLAVVKHCMAQSQVGL